LRRSQLVGFIDHPDRIVHLDTRSLAQSREVDRYDEQGVHAWIGTGRQFDGSVRSGLSGHHLGRDLEHERPGHRDTGGQATLGDGGVLGADGGAVEHVAHPEHGGAERDAAVVQQRFNRHIRDDPHPRRGSGPAVAGRHRLGESHRVHGGADVASAGRFPDNTGHRDGGLLQVAVG
jgi:hypothetical protein